MPRTVSISQWEQIKTAYAGGVGLREIARNMGISEGTVLARAKREKWTQQIATAKLVRRPDLARDLAKAEAINAISPMQSAAATMQQRAERHVERMAGITDKVLPHLESLPPEAVMKIIHEIEKYDRVARRNYGLNDAAPPSGALSLRLLTGAAVIEVAQ